MKTLSIRTDSPEAELGVFENEKELVYYKWQADRQLAKGLNSEIRKILNKLSIKPDDLGGIVVFKGPGSFTGLRIGVAVANTMAYALNIPIVATNGKNWREAGLEKLSQGQNDLIALPEYDRPAATTLPKK